MIMLRITGYFQTLLTLLLPGFVAMAGLRMFAQPLTALAYLIVLATGIYLGARYHYKHNRPGAFDDRLTDARMTKAREMLIETWKAGDKQK